jgi:tRNA (cytidine/uridine-2'-O-)-methyltransferase
MADFGLARSAVACALRSQGDFLGKQINSHGVWCKGRRPPTGMPMRPAPLSRLRLALYQPDIPQNAGTLLRTCACLGIGAAIIEPAGFPVSDRHFRRSGMDYLDALSIDRHASFAAFEAWRREARVSQGGHRLILLTTGADADYAEFQFAADDIIMAGRESAGAPAEVHAAADARIGVSMRRGMRSLNVAIAAAMVIGEALRQTRPGDTAADGKL